MEPTTNFTPVANPYDRDAVRRALRNIAKDADAGLISLIKAVRHETGLGLKEAKDLSEALLDTIGRIATARADHAMRYETDRGYLLTCEDKRSYEQHVIHCHSEQVAVEDAHSLIMNGTTDRVRVSKIVAEFNVVITRGVERT